MSFTIVRWRWVSEPAQTRVESFDNQAQAKRWMSGMAKHNVKHPEEDQVFVLDTVPSMSIPKALKKTYPYGRDNPSIEDAAILNRLYRKYVGSGPVDAERLRSVIARETHAAEQGRIRVSRDLLRELRADRALVGRVSRDNPTAPWAKVFG